MPDPSNALPPPIHDNHSASPNAYDRQLEVITAGAVVAIQVQLLTSESMATTAPSRIILALCMILELVGISLAICFAQSHSSNPFVKYASRVPTVLILMGVVGLGVVLVLETFTTSLSTAVTMIGFLASGGLICLLLLLSSF